MIEYVTLTCSIKIVGKYGATYVGGLHRRMVGMIYVAGSVGCLDRMMVWMMVRIRGTTCWFFTRLICIVSEPNMGISCIGASCTGICLAE